MPFDRKPSRYGCHPSQPRNRIRYFVMPNTNTRAAGFCPVYTINNQRMAYGRKRERAVRGSTFCKGYDKPTAIRMAKAMAYDEAERHYGGDDCTTVVYSARAGRGLDGTRRRRRRR